MVNSIIADGRLSFVILCLVVLVVETQAQTVGITILESAIKTGAVCLDGSPPAYFMQQGDPQKWLIMVEGGGWCESVKSCVQRRDTFRGSSRFFNKTTGFSAFLSSVQRNNPDFWDFTKVMIKYCDGSSFTGDVEEVDPTTKLHFRGQRIWNAIMNDLLAKGMKNAIYGVLTGCSAGGLTAILHCDEFKSLLPIDAVVKCVPDAGYIVNGLDIDKGTSIADYFSSVVNLHGSAKNLPQSCTSHMSPAACFFPQNVAKFMQTPLFLINSAYDTYQIGHVLVPGHLDPTKSWAKCRVDVKKCSNAQLANIEGFREQFIAAVEDGAARNPKNGYFIVSCYSHCLTSSLYNWIGPKALQSAHTDVWKAVGDWYFERAKPLGAIDPPYPSNPTCPPVNVALS